MPGFERSRAFLRGYNDCMDFFFAEEGLQRATPAETRITSLHAEPYPDAERVRVDLEMTPFQVRPQIEVTLTDAAGEEVATASIVEPMGWKLEFTLHLRGAQNGPFRLEALLHYPEGPQAAPVTAAFDIVPSK